MGGKFGAAKCKIMKFGGAPGDSWNLGDSVLEVVEQYRYLGVLMGSGRDVGLFGKKKRKYIKSLESCGKELRFPEAYLVWRCVESPKQRFAGWR